MCLVKKPKPPPVEPEDPVLREQVRQATDAERARRSADKEARLEDLLSSTIGGIGRRALLTGSKGGAGFAAAFGRSLLSGS